MDTQTAASHGCRQEGCKAYPWKDGSCYAHHPDSHFSRNRSYVPPMKAHTSEIKYLDCQEKILDEAQIVERIRRHNELVAKYKATPEMDDAQDDISEAYNENYDKLLGLIYDPGVEQIVQEMNEELDGDKYSRPIPTINTAIGMMEAEPDREWRAGDFSSSLGYHTHQMWGLLLSQAAKAGKCQRSKRSTYSYLYKANPKEQP